MGWKRRTFHWQGTILREPTIGDVFNSADMRYYLFALTVLPSVEVSCVVKVIGFRIAVSKLWSPGEGYGMRLLQSEVTDRFLEDNSRSESEI